MPNIPVIEKEEEEKKHKKKKHYQYYDVFKAFKHSKIIDLPPFTIPKNRLHDIKIFPAYAINTSPDTYKYKRKTTRKRIRM